MTRIREEEEVPRSRDSISPRHHGAIQILLLLLFFIVIIIIIVFLKIVICEIG